jgi:hypothetical protein
LRRSNPSFVSPTCKMDCFASLAMTAERARHTLTRHHPPPGWRNAPPDDRLRRVIQLPEAPVNESRGRGVLDRPVKPDDDSGKYYSSPTKAPPILPDGQITSLVRPVRCPALLRKLFRFRRRANQFYESLVLSDRGALANVINAGRDAVDAGGAQDESANCGRRSRVVLMPRRRHQVLREDARDDGDKKARSPGRARSKP